MIQRDIFPKKTATSQAKPEYALPTLDQRASEKTTATFTAGSDFTIPAGAAGSQVKILLLTSPILGNFGRTGAFGNSSFAFGGAAATTFTTEVAFVADSSSRGGDASGLSNGQYMIDYEAGVVYAKKADSGTTGTCAYTFLSPVISGGASGDVVGPASATDNAVALFDGATGKLLKNSVVIVNSGAVSGVTTLVASSSVTATSLNLTANSNQIVLDSDAGAGVTTILTDSATAARVLTFPDATDTLVGKATTDTLTNKIIQLSPIPGTDLTGNGFTGSVTVDTNAVGIGAALYMAADGHYDEADADAAASMPCTAVALETGTGTKTVLFYGFIRNDAWNWTPGGVIYVSNTQGTFTQTAPVGTGDVVQVVGKAESADVIHFCPSLSMVVVV